MAKTKILVLTDDMPWGHRSIARAIYGYLKKESSKNNLEISLAEIKAPFGMMNDMYTFIYRFFPLSNRITMKLMENDMLRKTAFEMFDYDIPDLKKAINKFKPDLVISAYFYHSQALVRMKRDQKLGFKIWTVVTDPWSINALTFIEGADLHLVYDEVMTKTMKDFGISKNKAFETGWWVREEMYDEKLQNPKSKAQIRKRLGFVDDRPVVFVGGGSLGTNALIKLLPVLMMVKTKVGLVFNTGTDKLAYNMVEEYLKLFKRLRRTDLVQIKNMGWIENMGEVLSACDIVFGKAGPNFLFDVVAVGKPFVAITHIGGQEDGNVDIIRQKKLGWVKEKGNSAAEFLLEYLKNPKKYEEKYAKTIAEEAERNRNSLPKILERIKEEF
jgi:UDP-N-acetylglucosamine:LPS N-acetylglucosamine transferase